MLKVFVNIFIFYICLYWKFLDEVFWVLLGFEVFDELYDFSLLKVVLMYVGLKFFIFFFNSMEFVYIDDGCL